MGRGQHADGFPGGFEDEAKAVVSKLGIPHYVLAAGAVILSTLMSSFLGGGAGPSGPAGPAGKSAISVPIGVCVYYGPDKNGHKRVQLSEPAGGGSCVKGWYLSLKPKS